MLARAAAGLVHSTACISWFSSAFRYRCAGPRFNEAQARRRNRLPQPKGERAPLLLSWTAALVVELSSLGCTNLPGRIAALHSCRAMAWHRLCASVRVCQRAQFECFKSTLPMRSPMARRSTPTPSTPPAPSSRESSMLVRSHINDCGPETGWLFAGSTSVRHATGNRALHANASRVWLLPLCNHPPAPALLTHLYTIAPEWSLLSPVQPPSGSTPMPAAAALRINPCPNQFTFAPPPVQPSSGSTPSPSAPRSWAGGSRPSRQ